MQPFRRAMLLAGAAALALNAACYAYQPMAAGMSPLAKGVRVKLTPEGTVDLARFLGPRVALVEGTVSSVREDGSLDLAVERVRLVDGVEQAWTGEGLVGISRQYITEVQVRTLNRRQTTIASLVVAGAVVVIAVIALAAGGAKGGGDAGGGVPVR